MLLSHIKKWFSAKVFSFSNEFLNGSEMHHHHAEASLMQNQRCLFQAKQLFLCPLDRRIL